MIDGAIIAAVDIHGRDRLARLLKSCLWFPFACAALAAQAPSPDPAFQDLRAEIAAKVAAAGATATSVECRQNLRERVCVAETSKQGARDTIVVSRPLAALAAASAAAAPVQREPALGLDARPLFAARHPILDVATAPDGKRIIVLEPSAVSVRQWTPAGDVSDVIESRPVQTLRGWPRDLRGRIHAAQLPFDVLLPGVTCRGDLDPLRLSCADESAAWPGLANAGVEAARNYFTTPEGRTFSSAAALPGSGPARWLIADPSGALSLLDDRRTAIAKLTAAGDDVAAIQSPCVPGPLVVVSNRAAGNPGSNDELRLYRVASRELVRAASPLRLPGTLTALWSSTPVVAVVHDAAADRYEAFHIRVSCAR